MKKIAAEYAANNLDRKTAADSPVAIDHQSAVGRLTRQFLASLEDGRETDFASIDGLIDLAAADGTSAALPALNALYNKILIGRLCDDFTSTGVALANQLLIRIIDRIRKNERGGTIDLLLNGCGFPETDLLLARYQTIVGFSQLAAGQRHAVKKIIIPSRVTVGADIVITSIFVHRLLKEFPAAELLLIGPSHLDDIFAGVPRLRRRELWYDRKCSFFTRISSWPVLYALVHEEGKSCRKGELLFFDPDTRLTQLGLLPVVAAAETFCFPSRQNQPSGRQVTLSVLANIWLNDVLGSDDFVAPVIHLPSVHREHAEMLFRQFPEEVFTVVVNFGVGGDDNKRVPGAFEKELVLRLVREDNSVVILDAGYGGEERQRVDQLLRAARDLGIPAELVCETDMAAKKITFTRGIIGFQGGIGALGALISKGVVFIGYDSCCQHLAAAVKTSSVIIFSGAPNDRFRERWHPYDPEGIACVIPVAAGPRLTEQEKNSLINQVVQQVEARRKQWQNKQ